jgi:hypothetical protein
VMHWPQSMWFDYWASKGRHAHTDACVIFNSHRWRQIWTITTCCITAPESQWKRQPGRAGWAIAGAAGGLLSYLESPVSRGRRLRRVRNERLCAYRQPPYFCHFIYISTIVGMVAVRPPKTVQVPLGVINILAATPGVAAVRPVREFRMQPSVVAWVLRRHDCCPLLPVRSRACKHLNIVQWPMCAPT